MNVFSRFALVVAAFATALYLALVVAAFGFITLLADLEPVGDAAAGRLVGPVMIGVSTLVLGGALVWIGLGVPPERQRVAPLRALLAALAAYAGYVLAGAVLIGSAEADVGGSLLGLLLSPHALAALVAAFATALADTAVLAARRGGRGRPRWPWERDED